MKFLQRTRANSMSISSGNTGIGSSATHAAAAAAVNQTSQQAHLVAQLVVMGFHQETCEIVASDNADCTLDELVSIMVASAAAAAADIVEGLSRFEEPQSEIDKDAKRRKKLTHRLTKLGKQVLSNNKPNSNSLETINGMKTSWLKLANENPMATLATLCHSRTLSSDSFKDDCGTDNDKQSGGSEDTAIDDSQIEQLMLMIGCSKDHALAMLVSKDGNMQAAAAALLLDDNDETISAN